jgi:hypothetical protein
VKAGTAAAAKAGAGKDAKPGAAIYAALFNLGDTEKEISIDLRQLGWLRPAAVRDLWQRKDVGVYKQEYQQKIPAHGAAMLKLTQQQ